MNFLNIIEAIQLTRRTGNTTLLSRVAKESRGIVVAFNQVQVEELKRNNVLRVVRVDSLPDCLRGMPPAPLLFDNFTVLNICEDALGKVSELAKFITELEEKLEQQKRGTKAALDRVNWLESENVHLGEIQIVLGGDIDELKRRIAAKDEALKILTDLGQRLQEFDPPGPATAEQQREDQYGRKIEALAREALKK